VVAVTQLGELSWDCRDDSLAAKLFVAATRR
jgi:hypothetical protein